MKTNETVQSTVSEKKPSPKSLTVLWVSGLVLLLATSAALAGLWMSTRNDRKAANLASASTESGQVLGATTQDPQYLVSLTNNLKTSGLVLYGFDTDAQTKKQLLIFGQALPGLNYVECDPQAARSNADECLAKGIENYPVWVKGDQKYPGYKSLSELEKLLASFPASTFSP